MAKTDYEKGLEEGRAGLPPAPWEALEKQRGWKKGNEEFVRTGKGGFQFDKLARPLKPWEKAGVYAAFVALGAATFFSLRSNYSVGPWWSLVGAWFGGLIGAGLAMFAMRYYWAILVGGAALYLFFRQ